MPGRYDVKNRLAPSGRAALALPFPPTVGPLRLNSIAGFHTVQMSEPASGNAQMYQGIYTTGISDCSVIAIVEWAGNQWGRFYFEHLAGSTITAAIEQRALHAIGNGGHMSYAVVGQYYGGVAFTEADGLFDKLNVPKGTRSYYASSRSGMDFGLHFFHGEFGEYRT